MHINETSTRACADSDSLEIAADLSDTLALEDGLMSFDVEVYLSQPITSASASELLCSSGKLDVGQLSELIPRSGTDPGSGLEKLCPATS
jgi:hypothetical protein